MCESCGCGGTVQVRLRTDEADAEPAPEAEVPA